MLSNLNIFYLGHDAERKIAIEVVEHDGRTVLFRSFDMQTERREIVGVATLLLGDPASYNLLSPESPEKEKEKLLRFVEDRRPGAIKTVYHRGVWSNTDDVGSQLQQMVQCRMDDMIAEIRTKLELL